MAESVHSFGYLCVMLCRLPAMPKKQRIIDPGGELSLRHVQEDSLEQHFAAIKARFPTFILNSPWSCSATSFATPTLSTRCSIQGHTIHPRCHHSILTEQRIGGTELQKHGKGFCLEGCLVALQTFSLLKKGGIFGRR